MSLRDEVKYQIDQNWSPRVPDEKGVLEQAKSQLKRGKSSGNVCLDVKALKKLREEKER